MLAKAVAQLPDEGDWLFEPKWDGFRAIVFRTGADVFIQSRDLRPLDRYFPELHEALAAALPDGCVLDGEIVIATPGGLDFDALQQRLHPADSRVRRLAVETPASFVAFDLLSVAGRSLLDAPQAERRTALEKLLGRVKPPVHLTPMTRDLGVAQRWLKEFEGAGLDGVIAKPAQAVYQPGKRAMLKIKHVRTADCVVAGFRWYKAESDAIGSLLLGLFDERGVLQHVGAASAFTIERRRELAAELEPLRKNALKNHPWAGWAGEGNDEANRMPGAKSRWSAGKDMAWEPLVASRVCEVKYDHLQGNRFRHATQFLRWRSDKLPRDCRYDQLEAVTPMALAEVFAGEIKPVARRTSR